MMIPHRGNGGPGAEDVTIIGDHLFYLLNMGDGWFCATCGVSDGGDGEITPEQHARYSS